MKYQLKISGLDCPNCARKLEEAINKLKGVKNAKIEFVKNTLTFESENYTQAKLDIIKLAKVMEPDAKITEPNITTKTSNKKLILNIALIVVGVAIGVVLYFVKMPTWCYWTFYIISALLLGYKTYIKAITLLFKGTINENMLITLSVIGATFVSEHMEGLMVIALYSIGKLFEGLAVDKSRKSIEKLAKLQPEYAYVVSPDGSVVQTEPQKVKVGNTILVKVGDKVPLDGEILSGESFVDMQSLTGESVPVKLKKGNKILSGSIVLDSALTIKTTKAYENSTISKIMNLVENASQNKSKTETFISKITKWYTLGVVLLAISVFGIVFAVTKDFNTAFYRGLTFLVVSCPCAFAISVPLAYFSGLGNASKHGVLIKGSNFLDACAKLNLIAFDKTGTLTTGKFKIEKIDVLDKTKTKQDILYLASLGEQYSIHPLAKAITADCHKKLEKVDEVKEIAGSGVQFKYNQKTYFVGRLDDSLTITAVELYENNTKIGQINLTDSIKHTAPQTCQELKNMGIKTVMLSGDNNEIAKTVGDKVGVDEIVAKLLPQDKYNYIKTYQNNKYRVGYVGDGINDAPSLTLADVGISMGINGSAVSVEASDIVLVDDNPIKIIDAIKISKYTKKIVIENIAISAIVKIIFLTLGALGITGMLFSVFADVGVTLLAIFNSMRALKYNPKKNKKN